MISVPTTRKFAFNRGQMLQILLLWTHGMKGTWNNVATDAARTNDRLFIFDIDFKIARRTPG